MDEPQCIKYDMCHVVKNRIRRKNTQRAYCIKEEGYECAFFLPKIKSAFDKFTNMSCDGCEAEECASACQTWINEHDAAIARKAREDVLEELKADLQTRFILSSNQWSKGRNSGLIECCGIIDEHMSTPEQPKEARR